MKILLKMVLCLNLFLLSFNIAAQEEALVKVCKTSTGSSLHDFKQAVKDTKLKLRDLYPNLRCNGLELLGFAMNDGSPNILKHIINRTKRRDLQTIEGSPSVEWMINNGHNSKEAFEELKEKLG